MGRPRKDINVCQDTDEVYAYINSIKQKLSSQEYQQAVEYIARVKSELTTWAQTQPLTVLKAFDTASELEKQSNLAISEFPVIPRDLFKYKLHYVLNGIQRVVDEEKVARAHEQKEASRTATQERPPQQQQKSTDTHEQREATQTINPQADTPATDKSPEPESDADKTIVESTQHYAEHTTPVLKRVDMELANEPPVAPVGIDAATQTDQDVFSSKKYCIPSCAYGGEQGPQSMTRCILCMKWHHISCTDDPGEAKYSKACWTCPVCRSVPRRILELQSELQRVTSLLTKLILPHAHADTLPASSTPATVSSAPAANTSEHHEPQDAQSTSAASASSTQSSDLVETGHNTADSSPAAAPTPENQDAETDHSAAAASPHSSQSSEPEDAESEAEDEGDIPTEWCVQSQAKRQAKKQQARAQQEAPKYSVTLICDSIPKNTDTGAVARRASAAMQIERRGSDIRRTVDYIQEESAPNNIEPNHPIIIHTGTNHIERESPNRVIQRFERLEHNLRVQNRSHVAISGLVYRHTSVDTRKNVYTVNNELAMMCARNNWIYIDNSNIDDKCLSSDGVHLNGYGEERLTVNLCNGIKDLCH